ncbi:MAG: radical SAM protein [bacterium]
MLKIVVGYPPIETSKGTPLLSQNRQFQYFNSPTFIYPMVLAYSATLLKLAGHKVYWMDGISEKKTYSLWEEELKAINPDYLIMETKAPVIKLHWQIIRKLKKENRKLKIILVGDHVTFNPLESFENSLVDYIITGGDYDFVLKNFFDHLTKETKLEGGVYWRVSDKGIKQKPVSIDKLSSALTIANSGEISLKHNLDELPFIDRDLTKWELYAYENGNYKYRPATYMYSGRDCWWNRCTFCVWDQILNPRGSYRSFSPERLFSEVKYVVDKYKVKEIFDDAGTLFVGSKLKKFCELLIESGYNKKVVFGCNMRFNALNKEAYELMKKANFRFLLYGMESGNQKTLDKLDKGIKVEDIKNGAKMASLAGLEVHATVMLGYPWESYKDAKETIRLARECFDKGYFSSMQATIVIPYPGTSLWKECKENKWLLTEDYNEYDMRKPVMKTPMSKEQILELTQELYSAFLTPKFIIRKILSIRNIDDIKFFAMAAKRLFGHLMDFDKDQKKGMLNPKFWVRFIKAMSSKLFSSDNTKSSGREIKA